MAGRILDDHDTLTMRTKIAAWFLLSRPPFHSVGVLPFVLGTVLARWRGSLIRWDVLLWGVTGVVLIMLATYFAGEYWDYEEDLLSGRAGGSPANPANPAGHTGHSRFAGGSQVVQQNLLPRRAPLYGALVSLVLAGAVGLILQLGYRTGPWTLPFGLLGMLGGFFYSARPVRWVGRGWGELWIAFCYGWLPVAVGYYLQTGALIPLVHWLAGPIGLTIFDVILLNEFPDYPADLAAGKTNLTVRLGRERAARLYSAIQVAGWLAMGLALRYGVPGRAVWAYLPVWAISALLLVRVLAGDWRDRAALERLCAANLLVNLGTTAALILAFAIRP